MNAELVAREYARVLSHFTDDEAARVGAFLRSVGSAAQKTPAIRNFLNHPAIAREEKVRVLLKIAAQEVFPPIVERVLLDLIKRRATGLFVEIADEIERFEYEKRHIRQVDVRSASPLLPAAQERLIATLAAYTGGTVNVRFTNEPKLLSGLLVKIGDTIIDNTLKMDLDHIRQQLITVSTT